MTAKGRLLRDTVDVQLSLQEGSNNGKLVVRGEFAKAGVPTRNKRIYPENVWKKQISRLSEAMADRKVYGELDHPDTGKPSLSRVSHLVTDLKLEDGILIGEAEALDTTCGKDLQVLFKAGCKVPMSSRGWGTTKTDKDGNEVVQEDYRLVSFDFVADPADKDAYPDVVSESESESDSAEAVITKEEYDAQLTLATNEIRAKLECEIREEYESKIKAEADTSAPAVEVTESESTLDNYKELLDKIQSLVDSSHVETDESAELVAQLKIKEEELACVRADLTETARVAKELGYNFYIEQQIGSRADSDVIRKLLGPLCNIESNEVLTETLNSIVEELDSSKKLLEQRNAELELRVSELEEQARRSRVETYAERRLRTSPRSSKVMKAIERVDPEDEESVDEIVDAIQESATEDAASSRIRERVRAITRGGLNREPGNVLEEEKQDYNGLGVPLIQLKNLAGVRH